VGGVGGGGGGGGEQGTTELTASYPLGTKVYLPRG